MARISPAGCAALSLRNPFLHECGLICICKYACAVRLKISYVIRDGSFASQQSPWDVGKELEAYIAKSHEVSAKCRLPILEEYSLIQLYGTGKFENRTFYLQTVLNGSHQMPVQYPFILIDDQFDSIVDKTAISTNLITGSDGLLSKMKVWHFALMGTDRRKFAIVALVQAVSYKKPADSTGVATIVAINKWLENGLRIRGGKDDLGFMFL